MIGERLRSRRVQLVLGSIALLGLAAALAPGALGVRELPGRPGQTPLTGAEALEARWQTLLEGAVDDGRVDYAVLATRRDALAALVAALATNGPRLTPDAFPTRAHRLAYYLNAYNALVVFAVLELDVRRSVHDVHGWLEPVEGMGFFWSLRFELDGAWTHLYELENDVLRERFDDARVHAAINCASRSCPRLAPRAYRAATLEAQLVEATHHFTRAPHVRFDDAAREVVLSPIYEWYADDFGDDPLAWIAEHAAEPRSTERARAEGWTVRHGEYEWTLNGHW